MKLFVAIYNDCALLPHFLRHYTGVGVEQFFIAADPAIAPAVRRAVGRVNVVLRDDLDVLDSVQGGTAAVTHMRWEYSGSQEWVVISDLDEFAVFAPSLVEAIHTAEAEGANVVRGRMVDRVSLDGSLPSITEDTDIWTTFPRRCTLTAHLQRSVDYKGVLVKGHLLPTMAHHEFLQECLSRQELEIHHFKWNSRLLDRMQSAMEMTRAKGISWWEEYQRILLHVHQHGRIRWEDFDWPGQSTLLEP